MQAQRYYEGVWGVDSLAVKYTESGEMIRFSYRVLDPEKAATLNDKKIEPSLSDAQARVSLVVPKMEKIGQLRQSSTPVAGKSYWMAFSNSGRLVKPGHRVDVQIGNFHAEGLVVE
jgi:GTP-binding protein EngB required for normal cell division